MPDPMKRIDHFVWVVRPENIKAYVEKLSALFDVQFDFRDGPANDGSPVQTYVSWDAGLELIAPFAHPDARPIAEHAVAREISAHLEEHGEGPFGIVMRVENVAAEVERLRELGYDVSSVAPHLGSKDDRTRVLRAWTDRLLYLEEAFVDDFLKTKLIIGEFEYPDEVPANGGDAT